jgi:putative membrane protein
MKMRAALIIGGIVLGVLIVLPLVLGPLFGSWSGGWGMMGAGTMGGFVGMGLMSILWIVALGLIIWAIVVAARRQGKSSSTYNSALNTLKRRYAGGEIDRQEYEEKKTGLL